jgi:hypothetical protein
MKQPTAAIAETPPPTAAISASGSSEVRGGGAVLTALVFEDASNGKSTISAPIAAAPKMPDFRNQSWDRVLPTMPS